MTPKLQQFTDHLRSSGVGAALDFTTGPPATLTIPAKNIEVGPIVIYDEADELTVEIGRLHHSHFAAPSEAAEFVVNVLADRVCVTVDFLGDRCIGSSSFKLDGSGVSAETLRDSRLGLKGGHIRSDRYLWSRPIR